MFVYSTKKEEKTDSGQLRIKDSLNRTNEKLKRLLRFTQCVLALAVILLLMGLRDFFNKFMEAAGNAMTGKGTKKMTSRSGGYAPIHTPF